MLANITYGYRVAIADLARDGADGFSSTERAYPTVSGPRRLLCRICFTVPFSNPFPPNLTVCFRNERQQHLERLGKIGYHCNIRPHRSFDCSWIDIEVDDPSVWGKAVWATNHSVIKSDAET